MKFWSQKVEVQGHSGITYAGTVTVGGSIQYLTSYVELDFLVRFGLPTEFIFGLGLGLGGRMLPDRPRVNVILFQLL